MANGPARGKKNRKHGRNADFCKAYAASNRQQKNQIRRMLKHVAGHADDRAAVHRLMDLRPYATGAQRDLIEAMNASFAKEAA